ncbi:hypothetical protein AMTR_s00024p00127950 [Amborella trichopoda]|uniref:beta-glucosidase n=1 Tax=Amborella trichopoda TaxID=13333 RepID=W1PM21_AMBTC|nr:hypothetical protein AMTR_s00024p00127950 [Amborella trichopoda]
MHLGFVISDWEGIDRLENGANYKEKVKAAIAAGIDMVMAPYTFQEFINDLTEIVNEGHIPMARIDDAVRRILRVKFVAGLFEQPMTDRSLMDIVGHKTHRELAREAVRKSLVLLKNEKAGKPMLPLSKKAPKILVAGSHAHNLGYQCGGWTITWAGNGGNTTIGTTILEGVKASMSKKTHVVYEERPNERFFENNTGFSYAIVAVGETPYVESGGDNSDLTIPSGGIETLRTVCTNVRCLVLLVSGRPLVIEPYLIEMDALVAVWLPGSEGGRGIADVIFGGHEFRGRLSRSWFRRVDQLPMNIGDEHYDPLFPFGYGLQMNLKAGHSLSHEIRRPSSSSPPLPSLTFSFSSL